MTTVVEGTLRRSLNYSSFVDITDARLLSWTKTTLTFEGTLTAEEQEQVWARMESVSDADQAARANLRACRDAVVTSPTLANLAALAVAEANYQLGES